MSNLSRRDLIRHGLAGLIASSAVPVSALAAAQPFFKREGLPIGLQLYTLGENLRADLDGTLHQIAAIGYRTVEMAGYYGRTAAELKASFDRAGLACTSTHVQARGLGAEPNLATGLDRIIADSHVIGFRHVVMPMIYVPDRFDVQKLVGGVAAVAAAMTVDDWKFNADYLNTKGRALKAAGLQIAYHNHNIEFSPLGDTDGLEILINNTDPALVQFEMDVGWVVAGGHDPVALLKRHPGRFRMMHVKDVKATTKANYAFKQDPTEVGSGIIDWKRILPVAQAAGVRDYFVEQEPPYDKPRIDAVRISFDYLNSLMV